MAREQSPQNPVGAAGQPSWIAPVKPVVPDHELLVRIGGGSYGDVWLARSVVGTWRAVKVVFRDRFLDSRPYEREFSGIQKFEPLSRSNEGFIDVLQIGRNDAEGYFYYVMELADDASGAAEISPETYVPKTLAKSLLQRGRLPVSDCLELGMTLNLALTRLHEAGLIHRDIKPSNIIFVSGIPKLADIGLVIEVAEARSYVGTEGFIPPEGPNSPQADLYSLGKVLYEAGMGKDRKDFPEPLTQIGQAPDSTELLEFNAILLRACAANVKGRYQSAGEMNADLALLQSGGSVRRQRTLSRRLRIIQRAGALVTILTLIIGAGWFWQARETRLVRQLANEKARLAEDKSRLAIEKSALAEENRDRLVHLDIANGVRLMDQEDLSGALLWFADALPRVTNRTPEEEIHRIRIQQTLEASPRLLRVFAESNGISGSSFSPDGRLIALATIEGNLGVWDRASGQQLLRLPHPDKSLHEVRFDHEGKRLFVSSFGSQGMAFGRPLLQLRLAEVVNVASGRIMFSALDSMLESAVFSPDDRWLAVARTNHVIELRDTETGRVIAQLKGHTNEITMLTFSVDSHLLASSSLDQTVRIWRVPGGELAAEPLLHDEAVRRITWSADSQFIASATWRGDDPKRSAVQVWNTVSRKKLGSSIPQDSNTRALFFTPSGETRLFTGGESENTFCVWKVGTTVSLQHTFRCGNARSWEFSPDGRQLALGTDQPFVWIWRVGTWEALFPPFHHTGYVESVHFNFDGTRLLTTSDDGTAKIWSLQRTPETAHLELSANLYNTPPGQQRARGQTPGPVPIGLADRALHIIDPERLSEMASLRPLGTMSKTNLASAYISAPSGRRWALWEATAESKSAKELTVWSMRDGAFQPSVFPHPEGIWIAQFSVDDSHIAVLGDDEVIRIFRTSDGAVEHTVRKPDGFAIFYSQILAEPFDPNLRRLLGTTGEGDAAMLRLLDLRTGQLVGPTLPLNLMRYGLDRMRLSPDGTHLAIVGSQTWNIIDFLSGRLVAPPFKHGGDLYDVEWRRDGKQVLTAGWNVKIWDASTGVMFGAPMNGVASGHWSADGRFLVTREENFSHEDSDRVRVYDAATTEPVTPSLHHAGYVRWACITPGNRLITASDPNLLRAWDLKPTTLEPKVIAGYAQLLSAHRLSVGGVLLPIPGREIVEIEHSLRARAPELFE